jgi:curved DNA-binding protein CbpA
VLSSGGGDNVLLSMPQEVSRDYYEDLQVSSSAEPETIHRVYRLLAQQFHPDNVQTGNEARFRLVAEAYQTLSDPTRRAQYDVVYNAQRQDRWRIVTAGAEDADNDFAAEQLTRLTVLEILYTRRRLEPEKPGIFMGDLEKMIGRPREHLEFTSWYLIQKKLVQRTDNALLVISADGVDYLEQNHTANSVKRLSAQS